jgi:hypothetical protein
MHHRETKREIDDTRILMQGDSCTIAAADSDPRKKWPVFVLNFLRVKNGIITVVLGNCLEVNSIYHKISHRKTQNRK